MIRNRVSVMLVLAILVLSGLGLAGCTSDGSGKEIAVMVPSADHGWTGAVLTYAQEKADELNKDDAVKEKFKVKVFAATDVENQIKQVDDLLSKSGSIGGIVILPYDNGLQSTLEKIAAADIPFVQFDRVITSPMIDEKVVSNVKGDNEGIGYETAKRFVEKGLTKDDYVYEMIGDNSSVPELRSNGFRTYLSEQGWTKEEIDKTVVKSAATGWSRDTGKELFESWFGSAQLDTSKENWIFTHDDEIAIGVLESLNGSALDVGKKEAFLKQLKALGASSGLAEMHAILKDKHQTIARPSTFDIFSVTYDPAMIQEAMQVMTDFLMKKGTVEQDHVIPVKVVDAGNVADFKAFGTYEEK
ncbi:substrate-binding domain-containing protein [Paenibacillus harenae]|uniref:substrate-binding domain-containing protein n=1 Tax=Paenibacillus harenae TaxID=306543 RepID=UPI002794201B|nr:substrate-binding domain-containing protein [Paenibacillus harenae]MDQ0057883.1 ribose transport system substrate-binding protein [Paenibacillus harenae]